MVDTISMDVDAWIDRGRAGVVTWRDDRRQRSVQRLPLVQVRVREQVAVPLPSAEIWRFISDPANDGPIVGGAHVRTFVVPGTPAGAVGEMQCMVLRRPDGSWAGLLQQVVERVDGVRLAGRALSLGYRHLETATVADGLLTWEAVVEMRQPRAGQVHALVQRTVVEHLDRIAVLLRGEVPREQAVPFVTSCTDGSAIVDVDVTVSIDLRVPAEVVWAHLRDARTVALASSDPTATSSRCPAPARARWASWSA